MTTDYAPDISGVLTTLEQIGGTLSVAGFGTLYLSSADTGVGDATRGLGIVAAAFTAVALLATFAQFATQPRT